MATRRLDLVKGVFSELAKVETLLSERFGVVSFGTKGSVGEWARDSTL